MPDVSLLFNILANDRTAGGLNSAGGRMAKFKQTVGIAAVGILGAAAVMGKKAVEIASDTAESTGKVQTLLGSSSKAAMEFADTSATAFGMSKREALGSVGAMSAVQVAMGKTQAESAKLSVEYTKLSADLGSFNNASSAEVQEALTASLSGEYEMLKKYGIVVNDVTLSQEAARIGMKKTEATWTSAQKSQLSYNIIMASTKAAQGDFARTSGGLANQTKIMSARMDDLQGKIGAKLLPAVVKVAGALNGLLTWMEQNEGKTKALAIVVGGLAAAIVATAVAMKVYAGIQLLVTGATKAWTAAQFALNMAVSANPITLIIVAIIALVAIVVLIATKTTWFQQMWSAAWGAIGAVVSGVLGWIRSNWPLLLAILTGPIGLAVLAITKNWGLIKSGVAAVKGAIVSAMSNVAGFLTAPFTKAASTISGIFTGIKNAFRSAINFIIGGWNGLRFGIPSFDTKIPGIGKVGGGSVGVPQIPYLAKGGNITRSGMAIVGEQGPEMVSLGRGAQVTPLTGRGGGGGPVRIELSLTGADDDLLRRLRKQIRVLGGDVQVVLGKAS